VAKRPSGRPVDGRDNDRATVLRDVYGKARSAVKRVVDAASQSPSASAAAAGGGGGGAMLVSHPR